MNADREPGHRYRFRIAVTPDPRPTHGFKSGWVR